MGTPSKEYNIQTLDELLGMNNGEQYFTLFADSFCSINPDVEYFIKAKAVQSSRLKTSVTYLISKDVSESEIDFVGYFTLASKILRVPEQGLSNSEKKLLRLYSHFDETNNTYNCPAVLIAQFGRNFNKSSESIKGQAMMDIVIAQIETIQSLVGGKTVFLECENNSKLISFYESQSFKLLDSPSHFSMNNKELLQMYRIL